jgi:hypothetical protein
LDGNIFLVALNDPLNKNDNHMSVIRDTSVPASKGQHPPLDAANQQSIPFLNFKNVKLNDSEVSSLLYFVKEEIFPNLKFTSEEHLERHPYILDMCYKSLGYSSVLELASRRKSVVQNLFYSLSQKRHYVKDKIKSIYMKHIKEGKQRMDERNDNDLAIS